MYSPGSLHVCSGAIEKDIYTNTVCVLSLISGYQSDRLLSIHIETTTTQVLLYTVQYYAAVWVLNFVEFKILWIYEILYHL